MNTTMIDGVPIHHAHIREIGVGSLNISKHDVCPRNQTETLFVSIHLEDGTHAMLKLNPQQIQELRRTIA